MTLLVVGLGGAAGAISRYWAVGWVQGLAGVGFPWGTLLVNVTGSLTLGFVLVWLQSMAPSPQLRDLIAVGFLGSFTTFSTFSWETLTLIREGALARAGAYSLASVAVCVAACWLGAAVAGFVTEA